MQQQKIATSLGRLAVATVGRDLAEPVVFLHGLFLDRSMWRAVGPDFAGRSCIYIDLPAHGESDDVGRSWTQQQCVDAVREILHELGVRRCVAIGHSWGAITAVQLAVRDASPVAALGLFNMPFEPPSVLSRLGGHLQKILGLVPAFYARQVCKALYTQESLRRYPEYSTAMQQRMVGRPAVEIARMIDAVMVRASDLRPVLRDLAVPALAAVGEYDHVAQPPYVESQKMPGRHVCPQENPGAASEMIRRVVARAG